MRSSLGHRCASCYTIADAQGTPGIDQGHCPCCLIRESLTDPSMFRGPLCSCCHWWFCLLPLLRLWFLWAWHVLHLSIRCFILYITVEVKSWKLFCPSNDITNLDFVMAICCSETFGSSSRIETVFWLLDIAWFYLFKKNLLTTYSLLIPRFWARN